MRMRTLLYSVFSFVATACFGQPGTPKQAPTMFDPPLAPAEYSYQILYYTNQAYPADTPAEMWQATTEALVEFIEAIPAEKMQYRYAPAKWTIGEVLQHLISYEHIMRERAEVIAGTARTPLQHDRYTQAGTAVGGTTKTKAQLLAEFQATRARTVATFENFSAEQGTTVGTLDGFRVSARFIGVCISGHQAHHFKVLRERYL